MTGVTETQDVRAVVDLALRRPALVLIVVQALLILALLTQRARKRKAEAVVRESEKRFRVMTDTTPSLIWMCDAQGEITYLNESRLAFTGLDPTAAHSYTSNPNQRIQVLGNFMAEGEGFEPPVPFQAQRFSRPPVSTAHPSLRGLGT